MIYFLLTERVDCKWVTANFVRLEVGKVRRLEGISKWLCERSRMEVLFPMCRETNSFQYVFILYS